MKPLAASSRMLIWFCVFSANKISTSNLIWKILHNIFTVAVFIGNICTLTTSTTFFVKFISLDLEQALYSLFQIVGSASILYLMVVTFFQKQKINILFEHLSAIYDKSMEFFHSLLCYYEANKIYLNFQLNRIHHSKI